MNNLLKDYIEALKGIDTIEKYELFIPKLNEMLQQEAYNAEIIRAVRNRETYMFNRFSKESATDNMLKAKEKLIFYLNSILSENDESPSQTVQFYIEKYLNNFYSFLEALREVSPHKRASLKAENLQEIRIENEYDLQHLLFAALKPLCLDARKEVTEDSGVGAVRSDIKIPSVNTVIEAKCTRKTMNLKKLTEEIEADIVHYDADYIYFYIYDREKIIKDKYTFEINFNRNFDGKVVRAVILQPVHM